MNPLDEYMQTRKEAGILDSISGAGFRPDALVFVVSNPVDILTQLAQYLPLILTVISMLATPAAPADTPAQAQLRAYYNQLRALAGK